MLGSQTITDATHYFDALENNLGDDMITFMINLTKHTNLHVDMGRINVASVLAEFKERLENYKRTCLHNNILTETFVGRETEKEIVLSSLKTGKGE